MAITRRQFLKRTGLAAAGTFLGPQLFSNPFVRRALAETIGDRYLVVLFLDGGNDGLNTIVPYDDVGGLRTHYEAHRNTGAGGLRIAPGGLSVPTLPFLDPATGTQLGFHPGLAPLKDLYDLGKVAVIQGCGYPEYSLSHEESRTIWQTANPLGAAAYGSTGWVGRYLAANYGGTDIPGVNIQYSLAGEFKTSATSVLTLRRLQDYGFPYDYYYPGDEPFKREAFAALYASAGGSAQPTVDFLGDAGTATLLSSENYPAAHDLYLADRASWNAAYSALNRSTARDFREIAKVIYGVVNGLPAVNARHFQLSNGGYDTHSDQGAGEMNGQHFDLHKEVADAVKLFYDDCADMGVADKVCILVWSEFSRRPPQNDNGTDHGSQGPMFLIGGKVKGGVVGNHPNIDPAALDNQENTVYTQDANPYRSTDIRDVYGTVLKHWLNMPHGTVLSSVLPLDGGDPTYYWTAEDFDLDLFEP
jgi:uncharacterized protein (DUF1501 family)